MKNVIRKDELDFIWDRNSDKYTNRHQELLNSGSSDESLLHAAKVAGLSARNNCFISRITHTKECIYEKKVFDAYLKLGEKLGLSNSLELSYYFLFLLHNGYFNINHINKYDDSSYSAYTGLEFLTIFKGKGVCYEFSRGLVDFLKVAEIPSASMLCNIDDVKGLYYDRSKIEINETNSKDLTKKFNHMAVLIKDNEHLLFCPTNDMLFKMKSNIEGTCVGGKGTVLIDPYQSYAMSYSQDELDMIGDFLKTKPILTDLREYEKTRDKCLDIFKNNDKRIEKVFQKKKRKLLYLSD